MRKPGMAGLLVAGWACASGSGSKRQEPDDGVAAALPPGSVELSPGDVAASPEPTPPSEAQDPGSFTPPWVPAPEMSGAAGDRSSGEGPTTSPAGSSHFGGPCTSSEECEPGLSCLGNPANPALFEAVPGGYCSLSCQQDSDCARLPGIQIQHDAVRLLEMLDRRVPDVNRAASSPARRAPS